MTTQQKTAIKHHCRLAFETAHPRFIKIVGQRFSVIVTVDSGYESIEQEYGGSVWHASAAGPPIVSQYLLKLKSLAVQALFGVGDSLLGYWQEWTDQAYHVRCRLSQDEERGIGPAIDIRGTQEAQDRYQSARAFLPGEVLVLAIKELS